MWQHLISLKIEKLLIHRNYLTCFLRYLHRPLTIKNRTMQTAVNMVPTQSRLLGQNLWRREMKLLQMCMTRPKSGNSYTVISIWATITRQRYNTGTVLIQRSNYYLWKEQFIVRSQGSQPFTKGVSLLLDTLLTTHGSSSLAWGMQNRA